MKLKESCTNQIISGSRQERLDRRKMSSPRSHRKRATTIGDGVLSRSGERTIGKNALRLSFAHAPQSLRLSFERACVCRVAAAGVAARRV